MKNNNDNKDKTLKVNEGVEQPPVVNPLLEKKISKFKKRNVDIDTLFDEITRGSRTALSRAITLVESRLPDDQQVARELVNRCLPFSGNSVRIGITGVPGVGKSTFIETYGLYKIERGGKVAVLSIDPSSIRTKGSILGDKTRMEQLSANPNAYIRPSASAGTLGGVARKTRESIILCEAAGYDNVFVETVGVGQSETEVAQITDFFLLLMLAGGGDELQGIKRGIMEMAHLLVINKADGDNVRKAQLAKREYENALHLFPPLENGWKPKVVTASAINGNGLQTVDDIIEDFVSITKKNGFFDINRKNQDISLFEQNVRNGLIDRFFQNKEMTFLIQKYKKMIVKKEITPYEAAREILEKYWE
jgi:LAO/AO transport system kinase